MSAPEQPTPPDLAAIFTGPVEGVDYDEIGAQAPISEGQSAAEPEPEPEPMTITFYGASDDLVEVEGCPGADEFNAYTPTIVCWSGDLVAPDGATMRVSALYESCWSFAVGQAYEDRPLPEWPVRITQSPEVHYSVLLEIDAPAGTTLTNIWPRGDES